MFFTYILLWPAQEQLYQLLITILKLLHSFRTWHQSCLAQQNERSYLVIDKAE